MEIQRLFDFLEEVLITPSQTNKYKAFKCKWLGVLPKPSQGMMLIRYHGTYLPSGLSMLSIKFGSRINLIVFLMLSNNEILLHFDFRIRGP